MPSRRAMKASAAVPSALAAALLAGCAAGSVSQDLRASYVGYPAESFFVERGGPVSSVAYGKGGRIYLWFSGRDSAYRPGEAGTVDLIGNTEWWRGYSIPDYNPWRECRVDILAGEDGYIYDMRMHGGENDWRHVQRCREVFGWRGPS